jgi:hypothetical protein
MSQKTVLLQGNRAWLLDSLSYASGKPPFYLRSFRMLPSEFLVGKPLPHDLAYCRIEAVGIV